MYQKRIGLGSVLLFTIAFSVGADEKPSGAKSHPQPVDKAAIERLVRQLGSDRFDEREAASKALQVIGQPALTALRKVQQSTDPEVRRRAQALVRTHLEQRAAMRAKAWSILKEKQLLLNYDLNGFKSAPPDGQLNYLWFDGRTPCSEKDLSLIRWFDDAKKVVLSHKPITDEYLSYLEAFYRLEYLDLGDTKVTDAGLVHLKNIRSLEQLKLSQTQVTGTGLVHLKDTNVHSLGLSGAVTDAGLASLKELRKLTTFGVGGSSITDAGLDYIAELHELRRLGLEDTKVTDEGIRKLKGLRNLVDLYLDGTQVSDEGILQLKGLRKLGSLRVEGTQVTDAGVAELLRALPKMRDIRWGKRDKPKIAGRGYR